MSQDAPIDLASSDDEKGKPIDTSRYMPSCAMGEPHVTYPCVLCV